VKQVASKPLLLKDYTPYISEDSKIQLWALFMACQEALGKITGMSPWATYFWAETRTLVVRFTW
jgi:hypothetical protein